jgi:hypothetical protein
LRDLEKKKAYNREYMRKKRAAGEVDQSYWARRRASQQAQAQVKRPRCVVCDNPINYGEYGVRLDARTCGKRMCAVNAYRWFGPMKKRRKAASGLAGTPASHRSVAGAG